MDKTSIYSKNFWVINGMIGWPYISLEKDGSIELKDLFRPFPFLKNQLSKLVTIPEDDKIAKDKIETRIVNILNLLIREFTVIEDYEFPKNYEKVYIILKFWYLVSANYDIILNILNGNNEEVDLGNKENTELLEIKVFNFLKCPDNVESLYYRMEYDPSEVIILFLMNEVFGILNKDDLLLLDEHLENKKVVKVLQSINIELYNSLLFTPAVIKYYSKILSLQLKKLKKILRKIK